MRKRLLAILIALTLAVPMVLIAAPATASAADQYSGPYLGKDNFPPGCVRGMDPADPTNLCLHMRTGLNGLDSPQIDVLVLAPASPVLERDMRIMRQSIEMWEGGIDYLAREMGLDWLADGVDFHITVDTIRGGEFTTYPIVDPEIVVIATNPVGGIGIGVDPVDLVAEVFSAEGEAPCHSIPNVFDFEQWELLPGFDSHHETRSGTYTEDCGGRGGNVCFAVNGAIDPLQPTTDLFSLFDLVSHEVGHCLTLGHVGDGAEGDWGPAPFNDIMAYDTAPMGLYKCVSTLDVEAFATTMSKYLDVDGDGAVTEGDRLLTNDQIGQGGQAFQVQHPNDHLYASSTGLAVDCPQPDVGVVPGARTDWTPDPMERARAGMELSSPRPTAISSDGAFEVTGTVTRESIAEDRRLPSSVSFDDADDDATTPLTDITGFDAAVTATHVDAALRLAEMWPSDQLPSAVTYSLIVNGHRYDSYVDPRTLGANPKTAYEGDVLPTGSSTWDIAANTVTFNLPREILADTGIQSPYTVSAAANVGTDSRHTLDDLAPDAGGNLGIHAPQPPRETRTLRPGETITLQRDGGNTFTLADSDPLGVRFLVGDTSHRHSFALTETSDVTLTVSWDDPAGASDLDMSASAPGREVSGATAGNPAVLVVDDAGGFVTVTVKPYQVLSPSLTYTLTATAVADPAADGDLDGVADTADRCVLTPGVAGDGCPIRDERVVVYVDDQLATAQSVETIDGSDGFATTVVVPPGPHRITATWEDDGQVIATRTVRVTRAGNSATTPSPDPSSLLDPDVPPLAGYWMVGATGRVFAFGDARWMGNAPVGRTPAVDVEATPSRLGYWVVDSAGHVFAFGDARYHGGAGSGSAPPLARDETVTSMSTTATGAGYWLFTTRGRVLTFGDAAAHGDMSATRLNGPVLDSIPTPSGAGYYMVASDGGVFSFGDASFAGSMGDKHLNAPVQSLVPDADGAGYWLVASDGGIFSFDADFFGSMGSVRLNEPVTGMVGSRTGKGYLMVAEDGGIFAFHGSLGSAPPPFAIASVSAV